MVGFAGEAFWDFVGFTHGRRFASATRRDEKALRASGFDYNFGPKRQIATHNSGQITQLTDTVSGETVVYAYDALKRLTQASASPVNGSTPAAWTQSFTYDGFGNLTGKTFNGTLTSIPVNAGTNQLTYASYDLNGNMTGGAGVTLTYDEANRVTSASPASGGTEYYGYAPDNKRIYKLTAAGAEQWTFYGGCWRICR